MTTSTTKKVVRFADSSADSIHIIDTPSTPDMHGTPEEYSQSKDATKKDAAKLRNEGFGRLFEDSFANPPPDVQKRLNEFAKQSSGRGLERHTSQKHYEERMRHRAIALQAILLGQEQARKQGLKLEDVSEQLRELSIQYCCTAKIFARRIGKADEAACYKKSKSSSSSSTSSNSASKSKTMQPKTTQARKVTRISTSIHSYSGQFHAGRTAIKI